MGTVLPLVLTVVADEDLPSRRYECRPAGKARGRYEHRLRVFPPPAESKVDLCANGSEGGARQKDDRTLWRAAVDQRFPLT